jgi:CPA2 family monovalent cation:H+ antiporter-2
MEASAASVLEIGLVLVLATGAGWAVRRVGLPAILGYLLVGLIVSPFTPGYVADRHQLQTLADFGVVFLLFEVGIEIDPLRLRREHGGLLWAVPVQVLVTLAAGIGVAKGMGLGIRGGMLLGLAVALSSSVVVVNITRSSRRTTNPATESALLGWSVIQDITGVAISMGLLSTLEVSSRPVPLLAGGIALFLVVAFGAAWLLPQLLRGLRAEPDLFLMLSVASGLVLAGVGARVFEVPLALAAFVAGLAVGESPDADEARRRLLPFRDIFAVMFFVTLGTLIDPRTIPDSLQWLGLVIGLIAVSKIAVIRVLVPLLHRPAVRPWQLALGLGQVGEFSFVLGSIGVSRNAIPSRLYTALLGAVVLSIAASTVAVRLRPGEPRPGDGQVSRAPLPR